MCSVQTVQCVTLDTDHAADRCVYSEDTPTPTLHLLQTVMTSVTLSRCHAACAAVMLCDPPGPCWCLQRLLPTVTSTELGTSACGHRCPGRHQPRRRAETSDTALGETRTSAQTFEGGRYVVIQLEVTEKIKIEFSESRGAPTCGRWTPTISNYKNSKYRKLMSKKSLFHMKAHRAVQDTPLVLAPSLYSLCPPIVRRLPNAVHGDGMDIYWPVDIYWLDI